MKISLNLIKSLVGFILALNIYTFALDKIQFSYLIFYIAIFSILIVISFLDNIKFRNEIIVLFIILTFLFITLLYSYDFSRSFRYIMFSTMLLLIHVIMAKTNEWHNVFFRSVSIFSVIILTGTFFSFLFPSLYRQLVFPLFDLKSIITINNLLDNGAHVGLTNQTAANGFLISVGLGLFFSKVYTGMDSTLRSKSLILLSIIALLMTMKRSFIIANILSVIVLAYLKIKTGNKKIKKVFEIFYFTTVIILLFLALGPSIPVIQRTLDRFALVDGEIYTSGRDIIYEYGFKMFLSSPILGHGLDTVPTYLAENYGLIGIQQMHNIYLQLLAEGGIIGFGFISTLLVRMYVISYKAAKYAFKNKDNKVKYLLSSSLYLQTFWLIYGLFGNPLTENVYLLTYLLFSSVSVFYYKDVRNNAIVKDKSYERL